MSYLRNIPQIVQFGLYPLSQLNATQPKTIGLKSNLKTTNYTDGNIKTNGLKRNFKTDLEYNISFLLDHEKEDIHSIEKMIYDESNIVFFVEEYRIKPPYQAPNKNNTNYYRILYNYANVTKPLETKSENKLNSTCNFSIRLQNPFKYECDTANLTYIEKSKLNQFKNQVWGNFSDEWGGTGVWGADIITQANNFQSLTLEEQSKFLNGKDCKPDVLFLYDDIFYKNMSGTIARGQQNKNRYLQFDLPTDIGLTKPVIIETNKPLAIGTDYFSGIGLDLMTPFLNFNNLVEIESYNNTIQNNEALQLNESISIENEKTKSGFRITWIGTIKKAPKKIIIRTHVQDGIFDENGLFLDPYNEYRDQYKIEFLENSTSDYLLSFRGLYPSSMQLELEQGDPLQVTHNQISTTERTPKITIKNLKTWH